MKKLILITIFIISITNINCLALSKWDVDKVEYSTMSNEVVEEIIPINDNAGSIEEIDVLITILKDCDKEELIITPSIFNTINNYKHLIPGEEITINLKITNNSKYNYKYKENSFILSTDDITRYGISNNFIKSYGVGFDKLNIYDNFRIYRTYNEAIMSLYNDNYENNNIDDDILDIKLKDGGYSGIDELDKYYLDYYNNKYNLKETNLNDFTYSVIKEMFSGKVSDTKENNTKIIELSYNYFYNKLLYYRFDNELIDKYTSHEFSIGNYMREKVKDKYFYDSFKNIESKNTYELNNMHLGINNYYYSSIFDDYGLYSYMEFRLTRDNEYITPPNTGI